MKNTLPLLMVLALSACQQQQQPTAQESTAAEAPVTEPVAATLSPAEQLQAVLDAQPDAVRARYEHRHPQQTLAFAGIKPGMTVVEGLPGRGWYSRILAQYLGSEGILIGADYTLEMYSRFPFANEEFMARQADWAKNFPAQVTEWAAGNSPSAQAFHFGAVPEMLKGSADVVFFPRVLHNLARFQNAGEGDYLHSALTDACEVLKPGGVFVVVQHHAHDDMSDEFADGSHGYLKKDFVIAAAEKAGFEFLESSDINANPNDQPSAEDIVWRLPPSYRGAGDDEARKAELDAIGESNRMTLKFRRPL